MKRALVAAVLLAASLTSAGGAIDGHELLRDCRTFASPGARLTTYEQGFCAGFVSGASELTRLLNANLWAQKRFCEPKAGHQVDIMTELLARYLINHPEKRDQHGFMLLTDALAVAYPCKEQHQ